MQHDFQEKRVFMKLTTFFISITRCIFSKQLPFSESLQKLRLGYIGPLSEFCFFKQLIANKEFCMKTRLCNIFKTANAVTLAKTISEIPYNVLKGL